MPDTARPIHRHPPGSSRSRHQSPVLMSSHTLRHVLNGSLTFAFSDHTCRINVRRFRDAHHDSLQLTQLTAVWNPRLHNDSEGPTFISSTAFQSSDSGFYIRTSQSHSGHTVALAEQDEVRDARLPCVDPVSVGRRRGVPIARVRFLRPPSRTGRAAFTASGSPRVPSGWLWFGFGAPGRGDVGASVAVTSDRHRCGLP